MHNICDNCKRDSTIKLESNGGFLEKDQFFGHFWTYFTPWHAQSPFEKYEISVVGKRDYYQQHLRERAVNKNIKAMGCPQRCDFCYFLSFLSRVYPLKMTSEWKNNKNLRSYNFCVGFKNRIGFCVASSQMIDAELDF